MKFRVHNLKGCFRFKLDTQFASVSLYTIRENEHCPHGKHCKFPTMWVKQNKTKYALVSSKAKATFVFSTNMGTNLSKNLSARMASLWSNRFGHCVTVT